MSKSRRSARKTALQVLYQSEYSDRVNKQDMAQIIKDWPKKNSSTAEFSETLYDGVKKNKAEIDKVITKHSTNWSFNRISLIDRNILRIAIFELKHMNTPQKVILNEAIEIAKEFGDEKSPSFINGILDSIIQINPEQ